MLGKITIQSNNIYKELIAITQKRVKMSNFFH